MKQYLIDQIQHLDEKKKELQNDLETYVQDKSLPLSDRWEIFCLAGDKDLLVHDIYIVHYESMNMDDYWYDINRYSTIKMVDVVEYFEERKDKFLGEELNLFKEEILDKFIWSFELDW